MSNEREGLIGKANDPDPHDVPRPEAQSLPPEEGIDSGRIEEDLKDPAEKRNATDGYAPADEGYEPRDADEDLERFED